MHVSVKNQIGENIHEYPEIKIRLITYRWDFIEGTFELTGHDAYKWVSKDELINYDLAAADIPFVSMIWLDAVLATVFLV